MGGRKYPIHGDAGVAWFLVFDASDGHWAVEKVTHGGARLRVPLANFGDMPEARRIGDRLNEAIERAAADR